MLSGICSWSDLGVFLFPLPLLLRECNSALLKALTAILTIQGFGLLARCVLLMEHDVSAQPPDACLKLAGCWHAAFLNFTTYALLRALRPRPRLLRGILTLKTIRCEDQLAEMEVLRLRLCSAWRQSCSLKS